jgi:hypothetical protein
VQTHQIRVSEGRDRVAEIRRDLFVFPEIIDVFVTGRPDALVVVFVGRPRPGEWSRALRSLGYHVLPRRQAPTPSPDADRRRRLASAGDHLWAPDRLANQVLHNVVECPS